MSTAAPAPVDVPQEQALDVSTAAPASRSRRWRMLRSARGSSKPAPGQAVERVPLGPRRQLTRLALVMVFVLSFTILMQLVVVSRLQHASAQDTLFDEFRAALAAGVAPIGPADSDGRELALGEPVAWIEIPSIGLSEVIGEGTTPAVLFSGPGHRRDTPLPGQVGTSVVMGRRAAFGGPFARIGELEPGDPIVVTTGQGEFTFEVLGVRREGDPVAAPPVPGAGRLLLATADGRPFLPAGVLRVDADLVGDAVVGPARVHSSASLPPQEQMMASDARTLWALALWIQALILLALGAIWAWHRWGRAQAWVVFVPPMLFVGLAGSGEVARLLPNLS
jgi:sortase A